MSNTVFNNFDLENDVVQGIPSRVTYGLWSNSLGTLTTFYSSSAQVLTAGNIGRYFIDIYASADTGSEQVEFSLSYGHEAGSGSISTDYDYPTKAIYNQYRSMLLTAKNSKFTLSDSIELSHAFFISTKRANLKQKIDVGNWELHISGSGTSKLKLIDDSGDSLDTQTTSIGRVVNIVSGTIANGQVGSNVYGLLYPDYGIFVLSPTAISASAPIPIDTGSNAYKANISYLFNGIVSGSYFAARSEELISSTHYFIRAKNKEYNYSSNITFYSASDGSLIYNSFVNNPKVYITSVGLYNDDNELLAVAKLSQPVEKSFSKESLIQVRLDF